MYYNQYDNPPTVFISSMEDLESEITASDVGREFIFLKKQIYCPECDQVLKKSFIVEAKAQAYADKHTSYKKYSTHNPIVRDIDYNFEMSISDVKGSDANNSKIQSIRKIIHEDAEKKQRIENQQEEAELIPQIRKIERTLGIKYLGANLDDSRVTYQFDTHQRFSGNHRNDSTTIRITYDKIIGEGYGSDGSMFDKMRSVAHYLTGEFYTLEEMSRAFPNANYGELVLLPILVK